MSAMRAVTCALLLAVLTLNSANALRLNYSASTANAACEPSIGELFGELYAQNRPIYEQCQQETPGKYMLLPFSDELPSDAQLLAMATSKACLYFYQATLLLPEITECLLGGIGVKSAAETLLMTSQDPLRGFSSLSAREFANFLVWRHARNVAQQSQRKFDTWTKSALEFDAQLRDALARFELTIMEDLRIKLNGQVIGVQSSGAPDGGDTNGIREGTAASSAGDHNEIIRQFQLLSGDASATSGLRSSNASVHSSTMESILLGPSTVVALWLSF